MTKQNSSLIAVVMDRSGSMSSCRQETIEGFNKFLNEQKEQPGEAAMYYTQFDTVYEVVHNYVPVKDMPFLDQSTFEPRGMTALLDAIGVTIKKVGADLAAKPDEERPANVIFVIQTDGQENSSLEYDRTAIANLIAEHRDVWKWNFIFLGASENSIKEAQKMGIHHNQTLFYSGANSDIAFAAASSNVSHTRRVGAVRSFSAKEREESK